MNRINFHRGTFLEKEELVRMFSFLDKRPDMSALIAASTNFGLVSPGGTAGTVNDSPFFGTRSATANSIDFVGGYVVDSNHKIYYVDNTQGFNIPSDSLYYWVKVSYFERNYENGYVSVDISGNVSGNVDFEGIVRGQSSGVATCIRFVKDDDSAPQNDKVYQIVDIVNANNIILSSGYTFLPESQLRVIVLGSLPMGRRFTDEQLEGLYTFGSYKVELVTELVPNSPPPKEEYEYYLFRVRNAGGTVTIEDKRTNFWRI